MEHNASTTFLYSAPLTAISLGHYVYFGGDPIPKLPSGYHAMILNALDLRLAQCLLVLEIFLQILLAVQCYRATSWYPFLKGAQCSTLVLV